MIHDEDQSNVPCWTQVTTLMSEMACQQSEWTTILLAIKGGGGSCRARLPLPASCGSCQLDLSFPLEVLPHVRVIFESRACVLAKLPFHLPAPSSLQNYPCRVGFLALVSGLAIGSAVDDSRSRDRLILFLRHFNYLSLVETSRSRWGTFPHEGVLRSHTGAQLKHWRRVSTGTVLSGAVVRTWTPPQSFMPLARLGFRCEDEEDPAVVEAYNTILHILCLSKRTSQ